MAERTILIETDKAYFDPAFLENLNNLAEQFGVRVKDELEPTDSASIIRADRDERDRRDAQRASVSGGLRKDLSHLDRFRK